MSEYTKSTKAYLSLGSNIGNRHENIFKGVAEISRIKGTIVKKASTVFETEPMYYREQGNFLNSVIEIETSLEPLELLDSCKKVENMLGRERQFENCPRTLDIDIIDFEGVVVGTDELTLPHPRLLERAFVLIPLIEIAGDFVTSAGDKAGEALENICGYKVEEFACPIGYLWCS